MLPSGSAFSASAKQQLPGGPQAYPDLTMAMDNPTRRRQSAYRYTHQEDEAIKQFVVTNAPDRKNLSGNVIWMEMEKSGTCPGRSWASLRQRFLTTILPNLHREWRQHSSNCPKSLAMPPSPPPTPSRAHRKTYLKCRLCLGDQNLYNGIWHTITDWRVASLCGHIYCGPCMAIIRSQHSGLCTVCGQRLIADVKLQTHTERAFKNRSKR